MIENGGRRGWLGCYSHPEHQQNRSRQDPTEVFLDLDNLRVDMCSILIRTGPEASFTCVEQFMYRLASIAIDLLSESILFSQVTVLFTRLFQEKEKAETS